MNNEIYFVELDEQIEFSKYEPLLVLLSAEKRGRILNFHFDIDKKLGVVSDLFVRCLASHYLGVDNSKLRFATNRYGKPFLVGKTFFHYNVSHTRNAVAVAVSNSSIGVDIEKNCEYESEIATRFFTQKEQDYIRASAGTVTRNFYKIWTKKESYIKWKGKGLSIPLNSFDVLDKKLSCYFQTIEKGDYIISICRKDNQYFDFRCINEKCLYKIITKGNKIFETR